jgi:predicted ATPase
MISLLLLLMKNYVLCNSSLGIAFEQGNTNIEVSLLGRASKQPLNFTVSVPIPFLFSDLGYLHTISGLIGRNGTGKTSLLRAMAQHAIDGIPKNCQILHVEQEVTGDDTTALQCVLNADVERVQLLQEETRLGQQLVKYC